MSIIDTGFVLIFFILMDLMWIGLCVPGPGLETAQFPAVRSAGSGAAVGSGHDRRVAANSVRRLYSNRIFQQKCQKEAILERRRSCLSLRKEPYCRTDQRCPGVEIKRTMWSAAWRTSKLSECCGKQQTEKRLFSRHTRATGWQEIRNSWSSWQNKKQKGYQVFFRISDNLFKNAPRICNIMFSESLQQLAFYNRLFQLAVYLIFFALHLAHFDIFSAFDVSFYNKQSTSELRFLPRIAFHSKHKLSFVDFLHFFEFHYRVLYALLFFDSADTPAIQFERILANSIFV